MSSIEEVWNHPEGITNVAAKSFGGESWWDDSDLDGIEYTAYNPYGETDIEFMCEEFCALLCKLQLGEFDSTFISLFGRLSRGYNDKKTDLTAFQHGKTASPDAPKINVIISKTYDSFMKALDMLTVDLRVQFFTERDLEQLIKFVKSQRKDRSSEGGELDVAKVGKIDDFVKSMSNIQDLADDYKANMVNIYAFVYQLRVSQFDMCKCAIACYLGYLTRCCMKSTPSIIKAIEEKYPQFITSKLGIKIVGDPLLPDSETMEQLRSILAPGTRFLQDVLIPQMYLAKMTKPKLENGNDNIFSLMWTTHLLHIKGNGLRIFTLLEKALTIHNYKDTGRFLRDSLCRQTATSIKYLADTIMRYNKEFVYFYARLLNTGVLSQLGVQQNSFMAYYLMYIIEPNDMSLDTVWALNLPSVSEDIKESARKLAETAVRLMNQDSKVRVGSSKVIGKIAAEALGSTQQDVDEDRLQVLKKMESEAKTQLFERELDSLDSMDTSARLQKIQEMIALHGSPAAKNQNTGRLTMLLNTLTKTNLAIRKLQVVPRYEPALTKIQREKRLQELEREKDGLERDIEFYKRAMESSPSPRMEPYSSGFHPNVSSYPDPSHSSGEDWGTSHGGGEVDFLVG